VTRTSHRTGTRGFALAVTVFALVLIAALIAGVFFAARQETRLGENVQSAEHAFDAAEAGLQAVVAQWDPDVYDDLAPGGVAEFSGRLPGATGSYAGSVRRLSRRLFLIRSSGQDAAGMARRSLARLVRLAPPPLAFGAALSVTGPLVVGRASHVEGLDSGPAGWDCPPAGPVQPGVAIGDAAALTVPGCADTACVHGDPPVRVVATMGDSASRAADEAVWASLASLATKVYDAASGPVAGPRPSGTATGCDTFAQDNWGEPAVPAAVAGCSHYYPIILARGNLSVSGGSGQGILLISGDLTVDGGFAFYGPVVVRGQLIVRGGGGRFLGAVKASQASLLPSGAGSAEVAFSGCAVSSALLARAPATPLPTRSWAQLF
jgi:hypothetical protein